MNKISQKVLDEAVKAAKEEFITSTFNGRNQLVLDFINAFKYTTAGADEAQEAFICGQLDYYNRKLLQALDYALEDFINKVELTAEPTEGAEEKINEL